MWAAPDTNRDAVIDYVRANKVLRRSDYTTRPWRFVPLHARGPVTFACAAGKQDVARAAGVADVSQLRDNGDGSATCALDASK